MNLEAMAREAGLRTYQEQAPGIDGAVGDWSALERFAAIVRAQALEEAALAAIKAGDAACDMYGVGAECITTAELCAEAIRAIAAKQEKP